MYAAIGMDVFHSHRPVHNVGSKMRIPQLPYPTHSPHAPPVFILNIQLPTATPNMWSKDLQGETINVVIVWAMTRVTAEAYANRDTIPPCCHLFEEWCERAFDDDDFKGRFKLIAKVPK